MSSRRACTVTTVSDYDQEEAKGLAVHVGGGHDRVVMSEQQLCDDVLSTLPKLRAAVTRDTYGRKWKPRRRKNGVDLLELAPGGCEDGDDDLDLAHAVVAKTELHCHLNEVLNVLIHRDSDQYASTMKALCGRPFKDGRQLFQKRRTLAVRARESLSSASDASPPQTALVTVHLNTLRSTTLSARHRRTQKLAFTSCTVQYPSKDRAVHVMKTLPKRVHDELVSSDDRSALRRELDHLAIGFDLRTKLGGYSASSHTTRVFAHAYAATVKPSHYGRLNSRQYAVAYSSHDLAVHRENMMNPEARSVLETMVKTVRELETVIRRRRFGFQTFVYFPTTHTDASACTICRKHFTFFRKAEFCQLCGHVACGECSRLCDVEPRIGSVRKNRCCIQCMVRVDACVFDDEDIVPALGPVLVKADDSAWYERPTLDDGDDATVSPNSSVADSLFSNDATERSLALERLAQLISPMSSGRGRSQRQGKLYTTSSRGTKPETKRKDPKQVLQGLETHLAESLRLTKHQYSDPEALAYARKERDYSYAYDPARVGNPNVPLAPMPTPEKEAKRLHYIKESGVLSPDYDRSALNLLAQVAAQKLNCPIGFVSVVDANQFHCIGNHRLPVSGVPVPRDENLCMHTVYAEAPLILQNPQRDMRFAQMGVVNKLGVKFYAGFPIRAPDGSVVASLCAGDVKPHYNITTKEYATMEALTKLAADLIVPKDKFGAPPPAVSTRHPHQQQHVMRDVASHSARQQSRPVMPAY
jgi:hypothetical protein